MAESRGSPLPDEKLDEIRARAEAATPGPWHTAGPGEYGEMWVLADDGPFLGWNGTVVESEHTPRVPADFAFIAHSRTDVPLLLDQLAAERADRERLLEAERLLRQAVESGRSGSVRGEHWVGVPDVWVSEAVRFLDDTAP